MTTILVTGGSGFIGSHVISELRSKYNVLSLDRHANPNFLGAVLGDIRDRHAVSDAMAHSDGFIHLAGILGTQETIANPFPSAETNIMGGLNILEAAAEHNVPGVCIAVGNYWMNNTYSITKSIIERFIDMYNRERGTLIDIVRVYNAYGPGQSVAKPFGSSNVRKIMPSFICRALSGMPIEIYGDGDQIMDMVYVGDVAHRLVNQLAGVLDKASGNGKQRFPDIIECGTGRPTTVADIAQTVIDTVGHGNIEYLPMRPGEPPSAIVLSPVEHPLFVQLEDGIDCTVAWFRKVEGERWTKP